jgi:hypothetical protein
MNYPIYKVFCGYGAHKSEPTIVQFTGREKGIRTAHHDKELLTGLEEGNFIPHDQARSWRDPETIEEFLMCLPAPYGKLAVKAMNKTRSSREDRISNFPKRHDKSPKLAVMEGITWERSDEGSSFWSDVFYGNWPEIPQKQNMKIEFITLQITAQNRELIIPLIQERRNKKVRTLAFINGNQFAIASSEFKGERVWGTKSEGSDVTPENSREVDIFEFMAELQKIPVVRREVVIENFYDGGAAKVTKDRVEIGCQKWSHEFTRQTFLKLTRVDIQGVGVIKIENYTLDIGGIKITQAQAEELMAAIKSFES